LAIPSQLAYPIWQLFLNTKFESMILLLHIPLTRISECQLNGLRRQTTILRCFGKYADSSIRHPDTQLYPAITIYHSWRRRSESGGPASQ